MSYRMKNLFKADAKLCADYSGSSVRQKEWSADVTGWYKFEVGVSIYSYPNGNHKLVSVTLVYDHPEWGVNIVIDGCGETVNEAVEDFISQLSKVDGDDWNAAMMALGLYVEKVG